MSPPLDMQTKWFAPSVAYTMSKFGMSQCVLGMAGEFKSKGVGVNALWPHSVIATAAISNVVAGSIAFPHCRKPTIMADAAAVILSKDSQEFTGNFCVDDVLLAAEGVTDFSVYRVDPGKSLWSDFFVPDDTPEIEPVVMAMNPGG
jgi:citronellol/citronellal dehydrogenase